jgi:hypothetical protein
MSREDYDFYKRYDKVTVSYSKWSPGRSANKLAIIANTDGCYAIGQSDIEAITSDLIKHVIPLETAQLNRRLADRRRWLESGIMISNLEGSQISIQVVGLGLQNLQFIENLVTKFSSDRGAACQLAFLNDEFASVELDLHDCSIERFDIVDEHVKALRLYNTEIGQIDKFPRDIHTLELGTNRPAHFMTKSAIVGDILDRLSGDGHLRRVTLANLKYDSLAAITIARLMRYRDLHSFKTSLCDAASEFAFISGVNQGGKCHVEIRAVSAAPRTTAISRELILQSDRSGIMQLVRAIDVVATSNTNLIGNNQS